MTKRRLDDSGFANVLRQKAKEDPVIKQKAAQNTFAILMNSQRPKPRAMAEPSYEYFNTVQAPESTLESCYRCTKLTVCSKCTFCERIFCQYCSQYCGACQNLFCSTCSVIDYSIPTDQVFCVSCSQNR